MTRRVPYHILEGRAGEWRRWFAWRPVRTEQGNLVWMRKTWRRTFYAAPWFCIWGWEEYSDNRRGHWDDVIERISPPPSDGLTKEERG